MAFTRGWDSTTPAGTRAAAQIDDSSREKQVDLEERLINKIFVSMPNTTVEADLVVKPEILGNLTDRKIVYGPNILFSVNDEDDVINNDTYWQADNDPGSLAYGNLNIPNGVTITAVAAIMDKNGRASCTATFFYTTFDAASTRTNIQGIVRTAAGIGLQEVSSLVHVVDSETRSYKVEVLGSGSGNYRIYGFRITFDRPDCRNTW